MRYILVLALFLGGCYNPDVEKATIIWGIIDESCEPTNILTTLRIHETNEIVKVCGFYGDIDEVIDYER